jgi:UDP-glucose 4-epimerase
MKILITGGAGFIGSHLVEYFLQQPGYDVCCLDNFDPYYDPKEKQRNIEKFLHNSHFELVKGDIRDGVLLKTLLTDTDYIFHQAAQAGVPISVNNPEKSHEVNTTGTLGILKSALDSSVKKIINASSSSVYGKVHYLPFNEDHPKEPVSPYGVSKLAAEHYCRVFEEIYGLKTVSLRYFTVYGPRMRPDLAIHIFMKKALNNEPIVIFGNGTKSRDFTYIDDIVQANARAMTRGFGAYNIGGGHTISIQQLAEKIIAQISSKSEILYKNAVNGDAEHTSANTKKAEEELGWTPQITLDEGLELYKKWIQHYQL